MSPRQKPAPDSLHRSQRTSWLRAAVLGADDGVVSTAALLLGVAAAAGSRGQVLTAGLSGLVAGAASMAAGEYVSVSSQRDAERADIALEVRELRTNPGGELRELTEIYVQRGLSPELAKQVAVQLSAKRKLEAHLRDELGLDARALARPVQAAAFSAASFASAGALPILAFTLAPAAFELQAIVAAALVSLAIFGTLGAWVGGAGRLRGATRVVAGGGVAMAITALLGHLFHGATG